jgi:hypothetical protein
MYEIQSRLERLVNHCSFPIFIQELEFLEHLHGLPTLVVVVRIDPNFFLGIPMVVGCIHRARWADRVHQTHAEQGFALGSSRKIDPIKIRERVEDRFQLRTMGFEVTRDFGIWVRVNEFGGATHTA